MSEISRRDLMKMTGAAVLLSPPLTSAQPRAAAVVQNMDWVWGQGRGNVQSAPAFDTLAQYLWGIRTWWDVLRSATGASPAIASGQPEALPRIILNQSPDSDPYGAKERLKGVHGSDNGARSSYDAFFNTAGSARFFRTFVTCGLSRPNWNAVRQNLRWQCQNNPFSSVVASRVYARGHSQDRDVVNALYWLNCGQYHDDGARATYRRAAKTDLARLFSVLNEQITATNALARVENAASRRQEALDSYDPHPAPGRPDPEYLQRR